MTQDRAPIIINPNDQASGSDQSFQKAVRRQESGTNPSNDIYNKAVAYLKAKISDSIMPKNPFAPADEASIAGPKTSDDKSASSTGKGSKTEGGAKEPGAKTADGKATEIKATEIKATEKKASENKLFQDAPVFARKGIINEGTKDQEIRYESEDGKHGYVQSHFEQHKNSRSYKETHFGPKKEENYTANVTQFHSGLTTYEYENGDKIAMRKGNNGGWIDMRGKEPNSRHIVNFDKNHKKTSSVDISTDDKGNVIHEFSNGSLRVTSADKKPIYEKAVGQNGYYEERIYDESGKVVQRGRHYAPGQPIPIESARQYSESSASSTVARGPQPQESRTLTGKADEQSREERAYPILGSAPRPGSEPRARGSKSVNRENPVKQPAQAETSRPQPGQLAQASQGTPGQTTERLAQADTSRQRPGQPAQPNPAQKAERPAPVTKGADQAQPAERSPQTTQETPRQPVEKLAALPKSANQQQEVEQPSQPKPKNLERPVTPSTASEKSEPATAGGAKSDDRKVTEAPKNETAKPEVEESPRVAHHQQTRPNGAIADFDDKNSLFRVTVPAKDGTPERSISARQTDDGKYQFVINESAYKAGDTDIAAKKSTFTLTENDKWVSDRKPADIAEGDIPEPAYNLRWNSDGILTCKDAAGNHYEQSPEGLVKFTSKDELDARTTDGGEQKRLALQKDLQENYHLVFSKDGEASPLWDAGSGQHLNRPTRSPNLKELEVIKDTFDSLGFKPPQNSKPLEFIFFAGNQKLPGYENSKAMHERGKISFPPVYNHQPGFNAPYKSFQNEAYYSYKPEVDMPQGMESDGWSVQAMVRHEIGHAMRYFTNPELNVNGKIDNLMAADYGFQQSRGNPSQFLLKGKAGDLYMPNEGGVGFLRCDDRGQMLDGRAISTSEMRQLAQVPPGTIQWDRPEEAEPESLATIWSDAVSSTILASRSPQSHAAALRRDQELRNAFGRNGEDRKMRAINGRLVERNAANLKFNQEQTARAFAFARARGWL